MRARRYFRRLAWFLVFVLAGLTTVAGFVLVQIADSKDDVRRDIGSSLIGSSVIGFVFAAIGQIIESQNRRTAFVSALSEKQNLHGIDLHGKDLAGLYLVGKDFTRANLSGADLSGANLAAATLKQANLTNARMHLTILNEADLTGALLVNSELKLTIFHNAKLDGAVLVQARIQGAAFHNASLNETVLNSSTFSSARLMSRSFVWLTYINLMVNPVAILRFRKRLIRAAALGAEPPSLRKLRRRLLEASQHSQRPKLVDATIVRADLRGADLREVDLAKAKVLEDVYWDERTQWPEGFDPPEMATGKPPKPIAPWTELPTSLGVKRDARGESPI